MDIKTICLQESPKAELTCFLHQKSAQTPNCDCLPAVLVLPGGGYSFCSHREGEPIALAYLAKGFQAYILEYPVGEKSTFDATFKIAQEALSLIQTNAEEWRTNKEKIAVIGFSAGGHLAAMLSNRASVPPAAQILGYPCILSQKKPVLAFPVPSAEKEVHADTPPAFLFATADDPLVSIEHTLAYMAALQEKSVPFEAHIYQSGAHGLSLAIPYIAKDEPKLINEAFSGWFDLSVKWLENLFNI